MIPYYALDTLILANHGADTGYRVLKDPAFPRPDLIADTLASLDGNGNPALSHKPAVRLLPVECYGATEAAALARVVALERMCMAKPTFYRRSTAASVMWATRVRRGDFLADKNVREEREAGVVPGMLALTTDSYWTGTSAALLSSGTFHDSLDYVDAVVSDAGSIDAPASIALSGLTTGARYVLGVWNTPGSGAWYIDHASGGADGAVDAATHNGIVYQATDGAGPIGEPWTPQECSRMLPVARGKIGGSGAGYCGQAGSSPSAGDAVKFTGSTMATFFGRPLSRYAELGWNVQMLYDTLDFSGGSFSCDWYALVPIVDGGIAFTAAGSSVTIEGAIVTGAASVSNFGVPTLRLGTNRIYLAGGGATLPGDVTVSVDFAPLYLTA